MEALVALSLACNIVQLVDFGLETISSFQEIYKNGATVRQQDFKATADELANLSGDLRTSLQNVPTLTPLNRSDEELRQLAVKCRDQAKKLQGELNKLSSRSGSSVSSAVLKTWRATFRAGGINDIKQRLLDIQRVLDTKILVSLHQRSKQLALEQEDAFSKLDVDLQHFIAKLAGGFHKTNQVIRSQATCTRSLVVKEHAATRDHITKSVRNLQLSQTAMDRKETFLRSLVFPEINFRQEQIDDAHRSTCDWVFDTSGESFGKWSSFVEWLTSGNDLYWINGKAGSGKSTLMAFIVSDQRTVDHAWPAPQPPNKKPLIVSFFFWNAGNVMQKCARGLLQSILYQLLSKEDSLFESLAKATSVMANRDLQLVWSLRSLKAILKYALDALLHPLCVFLDGLDEFDEDESELLEIVKILGSYTQIKLCVSSRPSQIFEEVFTGCSRLKLQDLTRTSIKAYIDDHIYVDEWAKRFWDADPKLTQDFLHTLLDKAQGVFLWVKLVIKDILKGLVRRDTWAILQARLDQLPDDVEKIYEKMWLRYKTDLKVYVKDAELYFRTILHNEKSLLLFTIATDADLQQRCLSEDDASNLGEILYRCETAKIHLLERCAGLLEVDHIDNPDSDDMYYRDGPFLMSRHSYEFKQHQISMTNTRFTAVQYGQFHNLERNTRVLFLHRTARDFVRRIFDGGVDNSSEMFSLDVIRNVFKSKCALWRLDPFAYDSFNVFKEISLRSNEFVQRMDMDEVSSPSKWKEALYETLHTLQTTLAFISKQASQEQISNMFVWSTIAEDFLGAMAETGFGDFVLDELAEQLKQSDWYPTYVLGCATQFHSAGSSNMSLIMQLLDAGADPMSQTYAVKSVHTLTMSPWHSFLLRLARSAMSGENFEVDCWQRVLECFLDHGADAHKLIYCMISIAFGSEMPKGFMDQICIQATAVSWARHFLGREFRLKPALTDGAASTVEDDLNVVMIRRASGQWSRIMSQEDSEHLLDSWGPAAWPSVGFGIYDCTVANLETANLPKSCPQSVRERLTAAAEMVKRNPLIDGENFSEELAIPGWGRDAAQVILEQCGSRYGALEQTMADFDFPKMLLGGVSLDWDEIHRLKEARLLGTKNGVEFDSSSDGDHGDDEGEEVQEDEEVQGEREKVERMEEEKEQDQKHPA